MSSAVLGSVDNWNLAFFFFFILLLIPLANRPLYFPPFMREEDADVWVVTDAVEGAFLSGCGCCCLRNLRLRCFSFHHRNPRFTKCKSATNNTASKMSRNQDFATSAVAVVSVKVSCTAAAAAALEAAAAETVVAVVVVDSAVKGSFIWDKVVSVSAARASGEGALALQENMVILQGRKQLESGREDWQFRKSMLLSWSRLRIRILNNFFLLTNKTKPKPKYPLPQRSLAYNRWMLVDKTQQDGSTLVQLFVH